MAIEEKEYKDDNDKKYEKKDEKKDENKEDKKDDKKDENKEDKKDDKKDENKDDKITPDVETSGKSLIIDDNFLNGVNSESQNLEIK